MIEWVEELPRPAKDTRIPAIEELATRPGQWAIIDSFDRNESARQAARYLRGAFPNVEAHTRKHDGAFHLYARVIV